MIGWLYCIWAMTASQTHALTLAYSLVAFAFTNLFDYQSDKLEIFIINYNQMKLDAFIQLF